MKPRREITPIGRQARHLCVLAETEYDRMGAEAKGFAETLATYHETLVGEGMPEYLADKLTEDAAYHYWSSAFTPAISLDYDD